jgi:hypothetical protein
LRFVGASYWYACGMTALDLFAVVTACDFCFFKMNFWQRRKSAAFQLLFLHRF